MADFLTVIILIVLCAIFWRMGGADYYDKMWRRAGSSFCMFCVVCVGQNSLWVVPATALIVWGCTSYFGWVTNILARFYDWIEIGKEYWWNFFAENLVIQSSVLPFHHSSSNVVAVPMFALLSAVGKVAIDHDKDGWVEIFGWEIREDVASEWWHGGSNCAFLAINVFLI